MGPSLLPPTSLSLSGSRGVYYIYTSDVQKTHLSLKNKASYLPSTT